MQTLELIKRRIKTIQTTSKITGAMKLVATAKIKRSMDEFKVVNDFCKDFYQIIQDIAKFIKNKDVLYTKTNSQKRLWVLITSSLGLCGAFNINLCKYLLSKINKDDEFIVIGKKGYSYLKSKGFEKQIIANIEVSSKDMNYLEILPTTELMLNAIKEGKYQSVHLVYSKFINSLTFQPTDIQLIPLDYSLFTESDKDNKLINLNVSVTEDKKVIEYEPNKVDILKSCISIYTTTLVFAAIAEAKVCENAARRNAMETASDNAKQLIENLTTQYNRARQETITQEINEIVAGAGNF